MKHHAYLVVGSKSAGRSHAHVLFSLHVTEDHPDVHVLSYNILGIDDARMLHQWAYQKPLVSAQRHFILTCDGITHEAQNALLKLFEEPPQTSVFALVVSQEEMILSTLRSRCALVYAAEGVVTTSLAEEFLHLSYAQRLADVAAHTKEKESAWGSTLLHALESYLYATKDFSALKTILFVRTYSERRGASQKMLLEHVALSLPLHTK